MRVSKYLSEINKLKKHSNHTFASLLKPVKMNIAEDRFHKMFAEWS